MVDSPFLLQLQLSYAFLALLLIVSTAAIVEISKVVAVEQRFLQPLVDLVVHETCPSCSRVARTDLRRVLSEQLLEVSRAVPARVQACKQLDEGLEREGIVFGRLFGEASHHSVEELPGSTTELGPIEVNIC